MPVGWGGGFIYLQHQRSMQTVDGGGGDYYPPLANAPLSSFPSSIFFAFLFADPSSTSPGNPPTCTTLLMLTVSEKRLFHRLSPLLLINFAVFKA